MKCERFESMLADALGGELSSDDQSQFDGHIASCDRCRREYETDCETIEAIRSLQGPQLATMEREGQRAFLSRSHETLRPNPIATARRSAFRFAAAILISFTSGYAMHAVLMIDRAVERHSPPASPIVVSTETREPESLASALAMVHQRDPARSDLAKCMIAMFDGSKN